MQNRQLLSTVLVGALVLAGGCAMFEKYLGGTETAKSESERMSNVRVWLDDSECNWGDVWCEVGSAVGAGPKLKYEIVDADKMGAVSSVIINIFPEEGDGWSSGASHIVLAKDTNNPDAQMKPGTVYPLGSPPDEGAEERPRPLQVTAGDGRQVGDSDSQGVVRLAVRCRSRSPIHSRGVRDRPRCSPALLAPGGGAANQPHAAHPAAGPVPGRGAEGGQAGGTQEKVSHGDGIHRGQEAPDP